MKNLRYLRLGAFLIASALIVPPTISAQESAQEKGGMMKDEKGMMKDEKDAMVKDKMKAEKKGQAEKAEDKMKMDEKKQ